MKKMKKEIVIKIMIILLSAKDKFENIYLGSKLWKEKTFLNLIKEYNNNLITNNFFWGFFDRIKSRKNSVF